MELSDVYESSSSLYFYEDVYASEYKVKLGEKEFYGCLMPHEEVLILGKNFDMEVGFLYRINEYTTNIIRQNLNKVEDLWNWNRKVFNPAEEEIAGEDQSVYYSFMKIARHICIT